MLRLLVWLGIMAGAAYGLGLWPQDKAIVLGPGVMVAAAPEQTSLPSSKSWPYKGYMISALHGFSMDGRVLARDNYSMDRESDISPLDLTLGWQELSDSSVLDRLEIDHQHRYWRWRNRDGAAYPIPRDRIEATGSNMHMIPATDAVKDVLNKAVIGNIVRMKGYLVQVNAPDGWHWRSSTTRTDTGAGACELVWVESAEILR